MNDAVLAHLRCPNCRLPLAAPGPLVLRCGHGHSFDVARQGYVTLTTGRTPHPGDTADMITARAAFLAAGHYDFIAYALADAVPAGAEFVVDAGTGTGHYLARVLDALPTAAGLGLDVSKPALRRAARAHPRAAAALADLWRPLPLADASADVLLDVFAPRNGPEFRRVLRPGGVLLVVTPAADHLHELIAAHSLLTVDPAKADRLAASVGAHFTAESTTTLRRSLTLSAAQAHTLIAMTPSARHAQAPAPASETLVQVTAAVDLTRYRPG
jgi:23S rRNA (guanine745-N1)-methyltransferase